jgi:putative flippase GtrA
MDSFKALLNKLEANKKTAWMVQFIEFGLVGVTNTIIGYAIYALFLWLGAHYIISSVGSFIFSVAWSYMLNSRFVFKKSEGENRAWWKALLKTYTAYALTGLLLANVLLYVWVDVLLINKYLAYLINLIFTIPLNFILNKYWAFRNARYKNDE